MVIIATFAKPQTVGGQFKKRQTLNEEFDKWYELTMGRNNLQKSSKAEYLTQVYLTAISFSNPTYRQEDYGIDFTCTLTEKIKSNLYPTDIFAVQVKSNKDPKDQFLKFKRKHKKDLLWLYNNQIPYFLTWIDMENTKTMYWYSMSPIWYLEVLRNRSYKSLVFEYETTLDDNLNTNGFTNYKHDNDTYYFKIGKPFMTMEFSDLQDEKNLEEKKNIIRKLIKVERENILYRQMKLPLMRWVYQYKTNDISSFRFGWAHFTGEEKYKTINNPQDILTHIGQLIITLCKSYELHKDDVANGKKYLEHSKRLRKIIEELPVGKTELDNITYEYESYLKTLGFRDNDLNFIP